MSLQVLLVERESESQVLGVYLTVKLAKAAATEYVSRVSEETVYKKKQVKKDSVDTRHVLYLQDTKESPSRVTISETPFEFPVTKGKKKKDPNAPKKGMSAFMIFSQENRSKIKEANPAATFAEIGQMVGASWRGLNEKQKAGYTAKSEVDKVRYLEAFTVYTTPTEVAEVAVKPKKTKKVKVEA